MSLRRSNPMTTINALESGLFAQVQKCWAIPKVVQGRLSKVDIFHSIVKYIFGYEHWHGMCNVTIVTP
jgi:hypothetical protein